MILKPGDIRTEEDVADLASAGALRAASEKVALALASQGPSSDIALTTLAYLVENNYLDIKVTSNGSEWWDNIAEWVKGALRIWRCDEQNVCLCQR